MPSCSATTLIALSRCGEEHYLDLRRRDVVTGTYRTAASGGSTSVGFSDAHARSIRRAERSGAVDAAVVESKGPGYDPFSTTTASQTVGDLLAWTVGSGTPRST
jgi:hypothetical protein